MLRLIEYGYGSKILFKNPEQKFKFRTQGKVGFSLSDDQKKNVLDTIEKYPESKIYYCLAFKFPEKLGKELALSLKEQEVIVQEIID